MLENCNISGFADEINENFDLQLQVLKELGQKYIELRSADGINVADMTLEQAEAFQKRLQAAGVQVSALGSPMGKISITEDFAPHFEKFKKVVKLSGIFKTPYIRIFSFYIPEGEEPEYYRKEVFKRVEQFVNYAAEENVVLLHENEKGIYGDTAQRCAQLMEAFYGEHFKCTFDFANFVQCRQDTLQAWELLQKYTSYVHVKDALRENGEVVVAGAGDGNVEMILHALDEQSYAGFLSLEPHLFSFAGLAQLEQGARERKERDGIAAYRKAYEQLQKLLK